MTFSEKSGILFIEGMTGLISCGLFFLTYDLKTFASDFRQKGVMMKSVTLKDVAKEADVSYATVSRALSGNPHISTKTRKRILKICDEMGYTTDVIARSMVKKKTDLIGLIVPTINNQFMSEIAYSAEMSAREHGYNILLCNSDPDSEAELNAVKLLLGRKADGILIVPQSSESYDNIHRYTDQIPVVFMSENLRNAPQSYVTVDDRAGAQLAMNYLYGLGHRKILYFGRRKSNTHELRAEGYGAFCEAHGLKQSYCDNDYSRSTIEHGYRLAKELFRHPIRYTAVFASTDSNAIGIIKAANEAGIRIPEDLSLIGFDDISSASLPGINLTTVSQPKKEMALDAVEILRERIEKGMNGYTHHILLPSLIERDTCRPIE